MGINAMMVMGGVTASFGLLIGLALLAFGWVHPLSIFGSVFFVGLGNGFSMPSAAAGIVSVRPKLAGSASGLGGSLQVGGGAAISAISGVAVAKYGTPSTLLFVMLISAILAIFASLYVIYVDRALIARTPT